MQASTFVTATPLDIRDLPDFAARLSHTDAAHPDLVRLITWQRLERGADPPHEYAMTNIQQRIEASGQHDGLVPDRLDPGVLFALIIHIAAFWEVMSPDILGAVKVDDPEQRCAIVRNGVAAMLS